MAAHGRIDVHHHFIPPKFKEVAASAMMGWPLPHWSVSEDQTFNKDTKVQRAILSLTYPGPEIGGSDEVVRAIARDSNETAARIRDENPDTYGFFAAIPSPVANMQNALSEVAYALDTLKADGVCLFTSYQDKYLGHQDFEPLWAELNKRKVVVFVHPTSPQTYVPVNKYLLPPILDFTFETSKTAYDLVVSGTTKANPEVKIILSHAGGAVPYVWDRVSRLMDAMGHLQNMSGAEIHEQASNFYFDTALSGNQEVLDMLTKFAKPGHVLYGSDFPYAMGSVSQSFTKGLDEASLSDETKESINWKSASKLFPRLQ